MSRRTPTRPVPGPGETYATQPGVILDRTAPGTVTEPELRSFLHDRLIVGAGAHRRSGIWWTRHFAGDAAEVIDVICPADDPDRDELTRRMASPRAVLVIAWCIVADPARSTL